uniref:RRM domain-containing protein n=1 Tax=Heterorhabditis bacteriophora TaxID=37862 RepID=A0A1I7XGB5_HETBA
MYTRSLALTSSPSRIRLLCSMVKSDGEKRIANLLKDKIQGSTNVEVNDISNGCGSMYSIFVEATSFRGLSKVAQHKIVTGDDQVMAVRPPGHTANLRKIRNMRGQILPEVPGFWTAIGSAD